MKKGTKQVIFLSAATLAGMYIYNKFVESAATGKNILSTNKGDFYEWKNGDIYYTKQGSGSPVLLVHDANTNSSSYEWNMIVKRLEKNHTVYTLDLIGCGRSDKPGYNYTNYLYVQLLTDFIDDVIQEKTSVVATNLSASFVIMANQMEKDLFDKIILINPVSVKKMEIMPDRISKMKQRFFNIPIIGTFFYNIFSNPLHIDVAFRERYFKNSLLISHKTEDAYYEAAHLGEGGGRFLYGSLLGNYMNTNMKLALKNIDKPIYIIGSRDLHNNIQTLDEYRKLSNHVEITMLSNSKLYPQLEIPEKVCNIINSYLQ